MGPDSVSKQSFHTDGLGATECHTDKSTAHVEECKKSTRGSGFILSDSISLEGVPSNISLAKRRSPFVAPLTISHVTNVSMMSFNKANLPDIMSEDEAEIHDFLDAKGID